MLIKETLKSPAKPSVAFFAAKNGLEKLFKTDRTRYMEPGERKAEDKLQSVWTANATA